MRIPRTPRPCVPAQRKTDSEVESGLAMEPEKIFFYTITLSFSTTNLMDMTMAYKGKCDKCNRKNPKLYMKFYRDKGDGMSSEMAWCLECVRNAGLF